MLLGIDVGGTHTDAVAVSRDGVAASCKVRTDHADLLVSVRGALENILSRVDRTQVRRLNLSTTLSTNAIVEGRTEEVGALLIPGPGIDPYNSMLCRHFHVLSGSIDHRGTEVKRLDQAEVAAAVDSCLKADIRVFAVVGKFSTRNPRHENAVRLALCRGEGACARADFLTLGHELGGRLNFPRRMATAFFNGAVWRLYNRFANAVEKTLADLNLGHVKVNVLKADGGTFPLALSRRMPVQSIFSGPAASVMGIIALCDITHDSVILDIGGTTTDIAVFAGGAPLVEQDGINIGSHPTLVRALKVHSIGIGGDSALTVLNGVVRVGPNRLGPAVAEGGSVPTLVDALNAAGLCALGDAEASRAAVAALARTHGREPETLAKEAVDAAAGSIHAAVREMTAEINDRPVYTIHELLEGRRIVPKKVYVMGGPAEVMKMPLFRKFQLSTEVPPDYAVANAIGAALTRSTWDLELFADTEKNVLFIPSLQHRENIPRTYTLEEARRDAVRHLLGHLGSLGVVLDSAEAQITRADSFNMVDGLATVGRNIRVKCQVKPGVAFRLTGRA
ncbi:hydantoinase/oxoprolinase family protein [Desulfovibrio aminophilus]|uniref:hydantoinase/oxoprolinase family protein n=1 Tax=Desulfovibrio aminophilus TaxID=81425 RepID=UPI003391EB7F